MKRRLSTKEKQVTLAEEKMKKSMEDAQEVLERNIELRQTHREKEKALEASEKVANEWAGRFASQSEGLASCMKTMKQCIDKVLVDACGSTSGDLPEASPKAFCSWLQSEMGLMPSLVANATDFGAFADALTVAHMLQDLGCDHLKKVRWPNHVFPMVGEVRSSKMDSACKNVAIHFLTRFWMDGGGHVLAFEEAAEATRKV